MKFGDTLVQRSVPHWRNYNIDYTTLKTHVKSLTSASSAETFFSLVDAEEQSDIDGESTPVLIPTKTPQLSLDTSPARFETELFSILKDEHDRVGLFVQSKSYEINSRLGSIERQLNQLRRRLSLSSSSSRPRSSLKLRQKISKIESDILKLGEEIQNLSRFVSINRIAINKLLKKYRKWTGVSSLTEKVENNLFKQSDSFVQTDLSTALHRYTTFLSIVREPFSQGSQRENSTDVTPGPSSPVALRDGSEASAATAESLESDFDFDLMLSREDPEQHKAVYWVHKDNVVELGVLLLQYMRHTSWTATEKTSVVQQNPLGNQQEEDTNNAGAILLTPSSGGRNSISTSRLKALPRFETVTTARWAFDSDGTVAIQATYDMNKSSYPSKLRLRNSDSLSLMRLSRLSNLRDYSSASEDEHPEQSGAEVSVHSFSKIGKYLCSKSNSQPVVYTSYKRSRFIGLESHDGSEHILATLDENPQWVNALGKEIEGPNKNASVQYFPHALLTLKGQRSDAALFATLNQSHLVESVPNFSFEAHAYGMCPIVSDSQLPWLPRLNSDIRRVPPVYSGLVSQQKNMNSSQGMVNLTGRQASTSSDTLQTPNMTSRSGTSSSGPVTPNTNALIQSVSTRNVSFAVSQNIADPSNGALQINQEQDHPRHNRMTSQIQKYWNEYDNPASDIGTEDDNERFIYVDPDAPIFPGQITLSRWRRHFMDLFTSRHNSPIQDIESGWESQAREINTSRNRLRSQTSNLSSSSEEIGLLEDIEPVGLGLDSRSLHGHYGTFSEPLVRRAGLTAATPNSMRRDDRGFLSTSMPALCLSASVFTLLTMSFLLHASYTSSQARPEVDVAILVGVAAALGFTLMAVRHSESRTPQHDIFRNPSTNSQIGLKRIFGTVAAIAICIWAGMIVAIIVAF